MVYKTLKMMYACELLHVWLNGESFPYINKLCRRKSMYVCQRALFALYNKRYSIKLKCIALRFML
jgi:hypothetical protein